MGGKIRVLLLVCLAALAAYAAGEAYASLRPDTRESVPEDIYAGFAMNIASARYVLRECGGYIAVYAGAKEKEPMTVTDIETSGLRGADRAMLSQGIPATDKAELLALLEDLGS